MAIVRTLLTAVVIVALGASMAGASEVPVHKCRDAEGRISYQDQPCAGESLPAPALAPAPPWRPPEVAAETPAAPPRRETAATPAPAPNPTPLPTLYRCTDFEGKSRVTGIPDRRGRYVPLWVLGRHASPLPAPPGSDLTLSPGLGASGALYTYVEDDCRPMPRAEMCAWWTERLREVDRRVQSTFFDERRAYREEQAGLREYLALFCR